MTPVLIAGAGPSGLTCAIELARRGVPHRLVEAAPELFAGSRGKGLQPRTLEVFEDLGVLDRVLAGGAPFPAFRLYAGERVLWDRGLEQMLGIEFPATPDVPYPRPWLIPQWRTDRILHERLVELGGGVEFGTALTGLRQDPSGVTAVLRRVDGTEEQVRAEYLVGTDGGRGSVRRLAGFGFAGETLENERTLVGDVRADGLPEARCHIFTTGGDITERFSLWNLPNSPYFQLVASVGPETEVAPGLGEVRELFHARSARTDVHLYDLRWISVYRVNVRMTDRLRIGRVLLAGDAAHVHSSASGQGLNTSVQDAYNLGWKLAAVHRGADDALLDSYHAERVPVAADVLRHTTAMHHRGFSSTTRPPGDGPAIHQLDITYRHGPLALDRRPGEMAPRAGDRAPDAPLLVADGRPVRLFELLRGTEWTLLAFGPGHELEVSRPASGERLVARDAEGHARAAYRLADGDLALIRPDGHLAVVTRDRADVEDYLSRLGLGSGG